MLVHRHMPAGPEPFLNAVAPYRTARVVGVEGLFTGSWLADLCARAGIPFVRGHALDRKAIHGGKAQNDTIAAPKIAVLLRGGMLPQAYVYPAAMRAPRALLRRRMHLMRQRAELLAHLQHTNRQDHLPAIGQKIADKAHRGGVAERFPAPAVQQRIEGELALIGHDDALRRDVELAIGSTAKPHNAHTRSLRRTVPGLGEILSLVLLYEIPDSQRCPRVQACVAYGRLVTCAQASAGKRDGTSGTQSGNASLTWAFADAAVLCLRSHDAGQK
jgi:transposase